MNRPLLVTGSSGFIGRNLFNMLSSTSSNVEILEDDYLNTTSWGSILINHLDTINPSTVFHVGACSNTLEQNVQYMMIRNYESTKIISKWCKSNNCQMIFSSSAAIYGDSGEYPSNLYGWRKYVSEDYVIQNGGLALRYFNVYGPGEQDKGNMSSFVYQSFIKHKSNERILLFPGNPKRDFIYIDDVISANIHAMQNYQKLAGNFFEVSTGEAFTFEDLLSIFGLSFEYTELSEIPSGYQFNTCGDKSKWMPGWKPKFSLYDGLTKYKSFLNLA